MSEKAPRLVTVPIVLDATVEATAAAAKNELDTLAKSMLETFKGRVAVAQTLRPDEDPQTVAESVYEDDQAALAAAQEAANAAELALSEHVRTYSFQPIGYKAWRALKAAHPSKDKTLAFDVDSIAAPLLRDASHEPKLTAGQVEDLLNSPDWSEGEINLLLSAAVQAQS